MKKLSNAQKELFTAIQNGVRVMFVFGLDAYAFRCDTKKTVTNTVLILEKKGFIERFDINHNGCKFKAKEIK